MAGITASEICIFDWSAASGDAVDFSGKTKGTNYMTLTQPEGIKKAMQQDGKASIYYGGGGYFFRYDKMKAEKVTVKGFVDTLADAILWDKFFHVRQGAGSDPDYLCYLLNTSEYFPFHNYNGTNMNGVARGWWAKCTPSFTPNGDNVYPIQIEFLIIWS